MLAPEDFMTIQALVKRGVYLCDIAEQLGVHPRTVRRALARGSPPTRRGGRRGSVLGPHRLLVDQWLAEGVWNAVVIWRELQAKGYTGGISILRDYLHPKRALRPGRATVRFETEPGRQLQSDWASSRTVIAGDATVVHFVVNTLSFSRGWFHFCGARRPRTPSTRMRDWSGPSSGSAGLPARSWSTTRSVPCSRIPAGPWCASIPASWIWRGTTASSPAPAGRPGRRPKGRTSGMSGT